MSALPWAIVGPGEIAAVFADAISAAGVGRVTRVLGRDPDRRARFARRHATEAVDSVEALLDPERAGAPRALYVATPHAQHPEYVRAALERGVAVLCEKPLSTGSAASERLVALSVERGVPLMEGWMYRTHPQFAALCELVAGGTLGRPVRIEAEFSFHCAFDAEHRLFSPELGGGAILDVGGYPISVALGLARALDGGSTAALASARLGQACGSRAPSGVDADARATLELGSLRAELATAITREGGMRLVFHGSDGSARLAQPFLPEGRRRGTLGVLEVERLGRRTRVEVPSRLDCFALEAQALRGLIDSGAVSPAFPLVDHAESLAIARLSEEWRAGIPIHP